MPNPRTAAHPQDFGPPNDRSRIEVSRRDLPVACPTPDMALWNSHPRVWLPLASARDGRLVCPYCSTEFVLKD